MGEWRKIKLKEVLTEINERNKGEKVTTVLSVTNSQGFVSQEEYFEGTVHSENISNYKIVKKNQFAYNPSRVNVGSIDILKNYDEGALSPMYVIFEVDETKLLPEYFKYYFKTHNFFENVKNSTQGSVRNSLSFKSLADFEYLLPPIEEQEKIIEILKKIDETINKCEKQITYINEYKNILLNKMILSGIEYKLRNAVDRMFVGLATSVTKYYREEGRVILRNLNIKKNYLYRDDLMYLDEEFAKKFSNKEVKENDVLIVHTGSNIGLACLVPKEFEKALTFTTLVVSVNNELMMPEYLMQHINSSYGKREIDRLQCGNGKNNLNVSDLQEYKIVIPSLKEQEKIISVLKNIDRKINLVELKKDEYKKMQKSLMQKLLSGKVRVNI